MAPSAAETRKNYAAELIRLLEPRPGRVDFAIRLALISALTGLITEIYQNPSAALTIYVAFFLSQKDRATSLFQDILFLLVITVVIASIFLVARIVIDDPMWRVVSIAAISFGVLFLASSSKLKPIGAIIALIVGYALDVLGTVPIDELATRSLLYAWLFFGIPAGVSIVVNVLFATPPRRLAEQTIAWRLRVGASMLRGPDSRIRARFTEALHEGTGPIEAWLRLAAMEKSASTKDIAALQQAATSTFALSSAIAMIDRFPAADLPSSLRVRVAQMLEEMADIFTAGGYPIQISWEIADPECELAKLPAKVFADVKDALVRFSDVGNEKAPIFKAAEKEGFFAKDAFTNLDHVHYALRTTAAALFCYVLYSLLDWQGIHTCFITCYIVSLGTAAESVEKLALRIMGCLIGAALGYGAIFVVLPNVTSIDGLMIVIFVGALGAAYIAGGSPRISYAGFQIAFAFFLCVVQGSAPAFDLVIARDRVIGILIGNLVSYLALTRLWPVSVARRIDPRIAELLRRLSSMAMTADVAARRSLASEAEAALGAVEADLHLAGYEPEGLRPTQSWLLSRETAVREMDALVPPLLLDVNKKAAARLDQLAAAIKVPEVNRLAKPDCAVLHLEPLQAVLDDHMQSLERALAHADRGEFKGGQYALV